VDRGNSDMLNLDDNVEAPTANGHPQPEAATAAAPDPMAELMGLNLGGPAAPPTPTPAASVPGKPLAPSSEFLKHRNCRGWDRGASTECLLSSLAGFLIATTSAGGCPPLNAWPFSAALAMTGCSFLWRKSEPH